MRELRGAIGESTAKRNCGIASKRDQKKSRRKEKTGKKEDLTFSDTEM